MCLADVPVQTDKPLVGVARHVTRSISTSIVAKRLELLLYLISLSLGDIGVALPWDVVRWIHLLDILPVGEEEELVLDNRATEGKAHRILKLLVELLTALDILTWSRAKEVLVVVVIVDRAMEGICPRLRNRVHTTAREARLADIKGGDHHLKCIDCFERDSILPRGTETKDVVVHCSINLEAIETAVGSCERTATIGLGSELGDVIDTTRHGRHTLDITTREARAGTCLLKVKVTSLLPRDDHILDLCSTVLQCDLEVLRFTEGEVNIAQGKGFVADVRNSEGVRTTRSHPSDAEVPLCIRYSPIGRP